MTGKQLRNSILQWAIQGKLVQQDPNDEPASVLLERIRAEKARLVKEKKIKKDKNETIIYRGEDNSYYEKNVATGAVRCIDDEIPFDIPQGWEWCRFRSICKQLTDGTHNTPHYVDEGVPFISVKDMSSGRISFSNTRYISFEEHEILSARCNPEKGDLLLSKVGTTGIPALISDNRPFSIFVSLALIKFFNDEIETDYLIHLINSPLVQEQAKTNTRGVGNKNWVLSAISNTLIVIPPKNQQISIIEFLKGIESKLNSCDKLIENFERLNSKIKDKLSQSILQEAIQGNLVPQIESERTAEDLLAEIRAEKQRLVKEGKLKKSVLVNESRIFRGDDNKYYEQIGSETLEIECELDFPVSWSVVRLSSICSLLDGDKIEGQFIYMDAKYLRGKSSGEYLNKGRFVSKWQSIILVDGENSGEVFIAPHDGYMGSTFKQLWISNRLYIPYILSVIAFYKNLLRQSKRGAAIPHLNKLVFNNLLIGLPPLKEQIRIFNQIEKLSESLK